MEKKSYLGRLSRKYMFMLDDLSGLYSITYNNPCHLFINRLLDQESEKNTISTNKTKSSNFSHDSIMKSLL